MCGRPEVGRLESAEKEGSHEYMLYKRRINLTIKRHKTAILRNVEKLN